MAANIIFTRGCETAFLGPTDHRGSRVRATHLTTKKRVVLAWDHAQGPTENHEAAARVVLGDDGQAYRGRLLCTSVDGGGYVFVRADQ